MEFLSYIVVTSQSMNIIWGSHPLLLCLQTSKFPTLLKQLCVHSSLKTDLFMPAGSNANSFLTTFRARYLFKCCDFVQLEAEKYLYLGNNSFYL